MSDIRGLVIQSRLSYLEKLNDPSKFQQVLQKLSEPVRNAIGEQVFMTNLYSFAMLKDLDMAIGESLKIPLESIFSEIGKSYAALILDRYFFNYIQEKDPQRFLAQIERLYPSLWYFGQYTYKKNGEKSVTIRFDYDEDLHKPYCWFIQAFLSKGIEICGGKDVKISEKECVSEDGESCLYGIKWN
jgi:uncharacterized protein (TIGR02265 family)